MTVKPSSTGVHRECRAPVARELRSGDDEIDARRRSVSRSVGWMDGLVDAATP